MRNLTFQLTRGQMCRRIRLRVDKIANRLSLIKLHPAVRDRAQRELARCGHPGVERQRGVDNRSQQDRRSVTMEFHDVLAGEGVWRFEITNESFVNRHVSAWID